MSDDDVQTASWPDVGIEELVDVWLQLHPTNITEGLSRRR